MPNKQEARGALSAAAAASGAGTALGDVTQWASSLFAATAPAGAGGH
jgi:hypothetical protein